MLALSQSGLGVDLRRLREKAGMSTRSVAEKLGISHASVNRTELGTRRTNEEEVIALCALYGVIGRQRERLIERAKGGASSKRWFTAGPGASEEISSLVELEMEACQITNVALVVVPGLVQTPEYAREVLRLGRLGPNDSEWFVRTRMSRQTLLSQPQAPHVRLILDEAVLRRHFGNEVVMRGQLDHLLRVVERDNVAVQVIPMSVGGHAAADGSFVLMGFPEREPHVYLETRCGAFFLAEQEHVRSYQEVIEDLEEVVLDVSDSASLIAEIKEAMSDD